MARRIESMKDRAGSRNVWLHKNLMMTRETIENFLEKQMKNIA